MALTFGRKRCDGGGGDGREGNVNGMADDGGSGMHRRERERERERSQMSDGAAGKDPLVLLPGPISIGGITPPTLPPSLFTSLFSPPTVNAPTLFGAGDHPIRTNDIQANS